MPPPRASGNSGMRGRGGTNSPKTPPHARIRLPGPRPVTTTTATAADAALRTGTAKRIPQTIGACPPTCGARVPPTKTARPAAARCAGAAGVLLRRAPLDPSSPRRLLRASEKGFQVVHPDERRGSRGDPQHPVGRLHTRARRGAPRVLCMLWIARRARYACCKWDGGANCVYDPATTLDRGSYCV